MIVFKYTKNNGAEYLAHLDTLRHLNKILSRANIPVEWSKGFNPHMNINMSAPIAVGVVSESEFCLVETNVDAESFKKTFNEFSFKGLKCTFAISLDKKVSVAGLINRAEYYIKGVNKFDVNDILNSETFEFTNKKGERKEVRNKIFKLEWKEDALVAVLSFGNEGLRPDLFAAELVKNYDSTSFIEVDKTNVFINDKLFEDYLVELA